MAAMSVSIKIAWVNVWRYRHLGMIVCSVNVGTPNNGERDDDSVAWVAIGPSDDGLVILIGRVITGTHEKTSQGRLSKRDMRAHG
ncbi:hypothetical protein T265_07382 [Opisthorchis viverrini]|uniref:Uncharacterized protein n=1 Tax=Opisthorchis viverrini TaxID=6198 RepID=A0A074ZCT6_OPIVI|nr:hypothetical protein T265_07382 [Opisthorchis viverrini]KER25091.1 hypothetical protein T265_07382 [Opisthorchis viverrini]